MQHNVGLVCIDGQWMSVYRQEITGICMKNDRIIAVWKDQEIYWKQRANPPQWRGANGLYAIGPIPGVEAPINLLAAP